MSDAPVPKIRLMRDLVMARHDDSLEKERLSSGGIVVPAGSYTAEHEIMTWGVVVATGPGRVTKKGHRIPLEVKIGDKVLYNRFNRMTKTGEAIEEVIGEQFVILQEEKDIICFEPA